MRTRTKTFTRAGTAALLATCLVMATLTFGLVTRRWQAAPVLTGSMQPSIAPGALVVATNQPREELAHGDVIVFHAPTAARPLIVHRVTSATHTERGVRITTKGDANDDPDPWGEFEITDRTVWQVSRVFPGVGRFVLAIRSPLGQFLALVTLAIAAAWLFSEDRMQLRRRRLVKAARTTVPTNTVVVAPAGAAASTTSPRAHLGETGSIPATVIPSEARIDLDSAGRPVGLWISLTPSVIDLRDGEARSANAAAAPAAADGPATEPVASRSPATGRLSRSLGSVGLGALVVVGLIAGATAAQAAFGDSTSDELSLIATSSLEPPTRLTASVDQILGSCEVTLDWKKTISGSAEGYDVLRQPLQQDPLALDGPTHEPTGPYEFVAHVPGRKTETHTDVLPDDLVQLGAGFRYALRATRDEWTSALSEHVDVTALGACASADTPPSGAEGDGSPTTAPEPAGTPADVPEPADVGPVLTV